METIGEIVPFAKEMLSQGPSRGMVKIYLLGTTMALFGVVGVLVETVCLPFLEQEAVGEGATEAEEKEKEKKKQMLLKPQTPAETTEIGVTEAKQQLVTVVQRTSNRSHAS